MFKMRENPENRLGTSPRNVRKILNVQKPTKKDLTSMENLFLEELKSLNP